MVGAGQVDLAGHVGELGADPGAGRGAPDLGVCRTGGVGPLGEAGLCLRRGDLGVRAAPDPDQRGKQAWRQHRRRRLRSWSPSPRTRRM